MARAHIMYSVEVRCYAEELATVMSKMREWLDAQRFEPEALSRKRSSSGSPVRGRLPAWISSPIATSLPACGDSARNLAIPPVHTELPRRRGTPRRARPGGFL